jgi:uncharacterized membrane protein
MSKDPVGPIALADGLGWASAGLGAPLLLGGRRFLEAIGIEADTTSRAIAVAVGIREFAATATILGMRHRRVGAWSRVGGDLIDLSLLAAAFKNRRADVQRLAGATALVATILGLDLYTALRLTRAEGGFVDDGSDSIGFGMPPQADSGSTHVRTAITVLTDEPELRRRFKEFDWQAFDATQLEAAGEVTFKPAPGGRGVEIHLDHDPAGGGGLARKLGGRSSDQKINDDLRRFKALVETGVEPRSDKTPEGHSAKGQIMQRPGQPVGTA